MIRNERSTVMIVAVVAGVLFMGNCARADKGTRGKGKPRGLELPESRSFHMGFTTWSMDFTTWGGASPEAIERMYKTIAKHAPPRGSRYLG